VTEFYRIVTGVGSTAALPDLVHPEIIIEEPATFFHHDIHRDIEAMRSTSPIVGEPLDHTSIQMKSPATSRRRSGCGVGDQVDR
jgi:hypothetical protein